jgi:beta-lactamase regulating signal transducer with metallopeptidase domain
MHEHVGPVVYYLEVHFLYASIVCLSAWVLTSVWNGSATWKYWIWVATLLNFILPFGGFVDRFGASSVSWATQLPGLDEVGMGISRHLAAGALLLAVWLCGAVFMAARLVGRVRNDRGDTSTARAQGTGGLKPSFLAQGVPVRLSATGQEPSVAGVLRPYISLPLGIERLLSKKELDAVLIHEITHARRRDNLIGLLYEIALCGLWFHPLVWLTGFRLAMFRELSCDDSVIESSRGADLVTAIAKLVAPGKPHSLRAGAATFFSHRVTRLTISQPERASRLADSLLIVVFSAVFLACVLETIAHTGSCFKVHM